MPLAPLLLALSPAAAPPAGAAAVDETWTTLYEAPPGHLVAQTYVAADGPALTVYLVGSRGEVARRTLDSPDTTLPATVPGPPRARFFTSPDGLRLGRADTVGTASAPATRLTLFEGEGVVQTAVTVAGHAEFLVASNGSTIVAAVQDPGHSPRYRIEVFDGAGTKLALPWIGPLESERLFGLRLSKDGARLGALAGGRMQVFDARPGAAGTPHHQRAGGGSLTLSAKGEVSALADHGGVSFQGTAGPLLRVNTLGPPHAVAFAASRWAVVAEARRVHVVDLGTGATSFVGTVAPANARIGSLDVVARGGGVRVAVGSLIEHGTDTATVFLHVLDHAPGSPAVIRSWPRFSSASWNVRSPGVQLVAGSTRVIVHTRDQVRVSSEAP